MGSSISSKDVIALLVFAAVLIFMLSALTALMRRSSYRASIENRLRVTETSKIETQSELVRIRRSRSLSSDGHYQLPLVSLNKLMLQSGSKIGFFGLVIIMAFTAFTAFAAALILKLGAAIALIGAFVLGIGLPIAFLRRMRDRRQSRFEEQLPDAIDTLVRSLRAGHALAVAIASVGRNMADPIGAEFRLTAAEVTYGLDLETAMINLRSRVGQADLALIVLAVSIQARTGGNLAEILTNLSSVIRSRFKLRRRAHALSAEGRFSAILLSFIPVALFSVLLFISPNYYGDIWGHPLVKPVLGGAVLWMIFGDYVMYRMVRIRV